MLKKKFAAKASTCRVTFELPPEAAQESAFLCGDFNDWALDATPLTRRKDGRFSTTVTLEVGQQYRYRYWVDGARWENDWEADAYVPNGFGGDDSLIDLTPPSGNGSKH